MAAGFAEFFGKHRWEEDDGLESSGGTSHLSKDHGAGLRQ